MGTTLSSAISTSSGVFPGASAVRLPTRNKCVSTAIVGSPKALFKTTLAVLRPTPGKCLQSLSAMRHLATMMLDQRLRQRDHILGLVAIEPDGLDHVAKPVLAEPDHFLRRIGGLEQRPRRLIHAFVSCLGGKHHRDQKRKSIDRIEFAPGIGIGGLEFCGKSPPTSCGFSLVDLAMETLFNPPHLGNRDHGTKQPEKLAGDADAPSLPATSGFIAVMTVIMVANFVAGLVFFLKGAWPVVGFCGLDVALVWWAFIRNFADARKAERIEITDFELILEHLAEGHERREQRFVRSWVRVDLEEDKDRELVGPLFLVSKGVRTEIASFLGAEERKELASALRQALAKPISEPKSGGLQNAPSLD